MAPRYLMPRGGGVVGGLGRVAPGYLADLIAVEGDPRTDIEVVIRNVRGVLQGGELVDLGATTTAKC